MLKDGTDLKNLAAVGVYRVEVDNNPPGDIVATFTRIVDNSSPDGDQSAPKTWRYIINPAAPPDCTAT